MSAIGTRTTTDPVVPAVLDGAPVSRSTIGCIVPACDDEGSIAAVLDSLLAQTLVPDVIHVVVSNTSDATVRAASEFAGPHEVVTELGEEFTEVFVHDIGKNRDRRAGALNYGYTLVEGHDYLLAVDGDAIADTTAVAGLVSEAMAAPRIAGVAAAGGGMLAIFSTRALRNVMTRHDRSTPWAADSADSEPLLALQVERAGYVTRISSLVREVHISIRQQSGSKT
ncbi:glycosyltransferase [Microbacterium sp. HJ5]